MILPGGTDPISRLNEWHRKSIEIPPGTPEYGEKIDQFNKDFEAIARLDGTKGYVSPMGVFAGDTDPAPGSVNVPNLGSLKKTAEGFTLSVIRQGLWGVPVGGATYHVNEAAHTITAEETRQPYAIGYYFSAGGTDSYTLHTDTQTVTDHREGPLTPFPGLKEFGRDP